jgi:uncharacterized HhH-GPD family protein
MDADMARPEIARARRDLSHQPFVVGGLLEFGRQIESAFPSRRPAGVPDYSREDPFAFLIAILLDQSVPAERAWAAPAVLRDRLGTLAPAALVADPAKLQSAMTIVPMPHRFPRRVSGWILSAAERVLGLYGGNASNLWSDRPTASDLMSRLEAFDGIGQKKAAMAVEILAADGWEIGELNGSDVAYDIHVRRVFMRANLVENDTLVDITEAARRLHPERPGALDLPAWSIGRKWCRPIRPNCAACPIVWACPSALRLNRGHGV